MVLWGVGVLVLDLAVPSYPHNFPKQLGPFICLRTGSEVWEPLWPCAQESFQDVQGYKEGRMLDPA